MSKNLLTDTLSAPKRGGIRQARPMRSTQFDDRRPYEEELEKDWQASTTLHDACGRRQFTRLNSGLSQPPTLLPIHSEALGMLPVLRQAGNSSNLGGRKKR